MMTELKKKKKEAKYDFEKHFFQAYEQFSF